MILSKTNKKNMYVFLIYALGLLLYRVVLDYSFVNIIAPLFSYYMQLSYSLDTNRILISYIILVFMILATDHDSSELSNVILIEELVVMVIPMLTLYSLSNKSSVFMFQVIIAYVVQVVFARCYKKTKHIKIGFIIRNPKTYIWFIFIGVLALTIAYTLGSRSVSLSAFNFENIYDIRSGISLRFPFSYLLPWSYKILCMLLIVVGLYKKNILISAIGIALQLFFFLTYANKSTLFSMLLLIGVYFIVKKSDFNKIIGLCLSILIIVSGVFYNYFGSISPMSYLIRRALLVPARIRFAYYEFYSIREKLHFAENSIGSILGISSPYDKSAPKLIAEYLGVPDSYCNSGFWGDAYANFGFVGVVLFSIMLMWIVLYVEKKCKNIPYEIICPFFVTIVYNLNDGALFTWLLGGGGILALIILVLMKKQDFIKNKERSILTS